MALGDLMATRYPQSLMAAVSRKDDCTSNHEDVNSSLQRQDSDTVSSVYDNGNDSVSSMTYLPHNNVLCELRHEAFEAHVPMWHSDNGMLSKWRPKDRVSFNVVVIHNLMVLFFSCILLYIYFHI